MIEQYMNGLMQHRFKLNRFGTRVPEKMIRFNGVTYHGGISRFKGQTFSLSSQGFLHCEEFEIPLCQHDMIDRHSLYKCLRMFFGDNLLPCRKSEFGYRVGIWADAF